MGRLTLILSACLLLCQCSSDRSLNPLFPDQDPEAYKVYAAVFDSGWPWAGALDGTIVIREETRDYGMCLVPDPEWQPVLRAAINDYIDKNVTSRTLQSRFPMEQPYLLVSFSGLRGFFERYGMIEGWKMFHRYYPGSRGYLTLSAVGFNPLRTVAVVYACYLCGPSCGKDGFHVLHKVDGAWVPLAWQGKSCQYLSWE